MFHVKHYMSRNGILTAFRWRPTGERKYMYTIELSKGNVKAIIDTVKFRKKKDAEEWLEEFSKLTTPGTVGKVVKVSK